MNGSSEKVEKKNTGRVTWAVVVGSLSLLLIVILAAGAVLARLIREKRL